MKVFLSTDHDFLSSYLGHLDCTLSALFLRDEMMMPLIGSVPNVDYIIDDDPVLGLLPNDNPAPHFTPHFISFFKHLSSGLLMHVQGLHPVRVGLFVAL